MLKPSLIFFATLAISLAFLAPAAQSAPGDMATIEAQVIEQHDAGATATRIGSRAKTASRVSRIPSPMI